MNKQYTEADHTFVICAYKESAYLEECIISLLQQTVKSNIKMITSTDNSYIRNIALKYKIDLSINNHGGIAEDWNFACKQVTTSLITITHQDDIYHPQYLNSVINKINEGKTPLIVFTNYSEIKNEQIIRNNMLLTVKRILLCPLKNSLFWNKRFMRRAILSLGSPICCPSVTYVLDNLVLPIFDSGFRSDLDWQAWERISQRCGSFIYCNKLLMSHRIHEESETTAIILDNQRGDEDYLMFCKFWPKFIAKILSKFYGLSEKSNKL